MSDVEVAFSPPDLAPHAAENDRITRYGNYQSRKMKTHTAERALLEQRASEGPGHKD